MTTLQKNGPKQSTTEKLLILPGGKIFTSSSGEK